MKRFLGEAEQHLAVRSSMISSGIVLSSDEQSIQIQENSGTMKTLSLHVDAGFYTAQSNNPTQASSITVNDYVVVIHNQGVAYYVEISDEQVTMESFIGTMESISKVDLTISLNIDGVSQSFKYADDVEVLNAVKGLSLSDLTVGSTLELKRNSESANTDITLIIVNAAPVFKTVIGTIGSIQTTSRTVDVKETSTGSTITYTIPTTIEITNGTRTLLYVDDEVLIEMNGDNFVTKITVKNRTMAMMISTNYDGELLAINTTTKTIRINFEYYGEMSLSYTNVPSVEMFGKTNASLSDLKIGDDIQVILDSNQEKAVQIKLFSTQIYKVSTKYSYKLTVTGETSTASDIFNVSSIPITHYSKPIATYADITDNMYIEATMAGTTTTAIYIPRVTVGKLTVVNASTGSITIEEYGKVAKTITNMTSVRVVKGSSTTTTLNSAVVNDRAEVVEGKNGTRWITVITPVKKSFITYTEATKIVQLSVALLTDPNKFVLADNVYIHKGTEVITAVSLNRNDQIMVYLLNGKIVEIEKL